MNDLLPLFEQQFITFMDNFDTLNNFLDEALQVPTPCDCSNMSVDSIVSGIHSLVNCKRDDGNTRNDAFYAGICKDVKDNMQRHGNKSYVALVDCGTRDKSGSVETKLKELGFDVGKRADNGGDDESTIVYVIKKNSSFRR